MTFFRPRLEALEDRCTPSDLSLQAPLGFSPNLLTVTATTATLAIPNGNLVAFAPNPSSGRLQQAVLHFLENNGYPPVPVIPGPPGLFVAAGFVNPSQPSGGSP